MSEENPVTKKDITIILLIVMAVPAFFLVGCPHYSVWKQGMEGEGKLRKAQQEKKIMVEQALAEKEAATHRAEAIRIIGEATKKYPEYRQQELMGAFGDALKDGNISQIIYVPTEANIPIMEAGRHRK